MSTLRKTHNRKRPARPFNFHVRLSEEERARLEMLANERGTTVARVLRQLAIEASGVTGGLRRADFKGVT